MNESESVTHVDAERRFSRDRKRTFSFAPGTIFTPARRAVRSGRMLTAHLARIGEHTRRCEEWLELPVNRNYFGSALALAHGDTVILFE
jgi:hypothetical protein